MSTRHCLAIGLMSLLALTGARATTVALTVGDGWHDFNVDDVLAPTSAALSWIDLGDGTALTFSFSVEADTTARLTVVDAVTAGEVFDVYANGASLGQTSPAGTSSLDVGYDYAAALADQAFSRGVFVLQPGNYRITGTMVPALDGINATQGGLRLDAAGVVPELSTTAMLVAGLGALAFVMRRRAG